MKNCKLTIAVLLFTLNFTNASTGPAQKNILIQAAQDVTTVKSVYDGFDGDSYSFNFVDADGEDDTLFFIDIHPEILKTYNLKGESLIGKTFELTYTTEIENEVDEDGDTQEYVKNNLTDLKIVN